jgi:hypothetical protein
VQLRDGVSTENSSTIRATILPVSPQSKPLQNAVPRSFRAILDAVVVSPGREALTIAATLKENVHAFRAEYGM